MQSELKKEDLFLLMESYKNMIESNLNLMEKQDTILNKINLNCNELVKISNNLKKAFNEFEDCFAAISKHQTICAANQKAYSDTIKDLIKDDHTEVEKTRLKDNLKFYGLISLMLGIIAGLIGLIYKFWYTIETAIHHHLQ